VIKKFKNAFFDGGDSDSEISMKSKPGSSRGGAKAPAKRKPAVKPSKVIHEKINMESDDDTVKEPPSKRRIVEKGSAAKSTNLS